jgi:signal transduction histidine kinase
MASALYQRPYFYAHMSVDPAPRAMSTPLFFQLGWLAALCAAVGLSLTWVIFERRIRHLKKHIVNGAEQRRAERERIARDLHDTLLQGIHALVFRLQVWETDAAIPAERRAEIALATCQARSLMVEGRDRIAMLRRREIGHRDLLAALRVVAEIESRVFDAAFEIVTAGPERQLTPEGFEQLLDITKEAIINAFRHARASRILVRINYQPAGLRVEIEDDGIGTTYCPEQRPEMTAHFGVTGMRERASEMGGLVELGGRTDRGTRVTVSLPSASIYVPPESVS